MTQLSVGGSGSCCSLLRERPIIPVNTLGILYSAIMPGLWATVLWVYLSESFCAVADTGERCKGLGSLLDYSSDSSRGSVQSR